MPLHRPITSSVETLSDDKGRLHSAPTRVRFDRMRSYQSSHDRRRPPQRARSLSPRWLGPLLGCAIALSLLIPSSVFAAPRLSDLVDGVPASKRSLTASALPDVTMRAGALVDGEGRVLWSRRETERRSMASITKIMTAVVALEHAELTSTVTIPRASGQVGESTAFLRPGEKLPMDQVLEALLVKSGNDAAVAIARSVAGSDEAFVTMMNEKATELGLKNTHFANSHGLDAPGHYTTAADLAVLGRYAMTKPRFREIVKMKSVTIGSGRRKETLQSTDLLIGNYAGAIGIKTGFTDGAGYSVLSAAEREGLTLYAVVLGTSSELERFREARELLDWGFAHYRAQQLAVAGTVVAEASVSDYLDRRVPAAISRDETVSVLDVSGPITRTVTVGTLPAPIKRGQIVGVAEFTQAGKMISQVPLVATEDVKRPSLFERAWIGAVRGWRKVFGGSPPLAAPA
jgi:D-alanyl-D-alanine carboxypeptidase (penicillin-binding protein 5/6)